MELARDEPTDGTRSDVTFTALATTVQTTLTVDHIMASAAIPLVFPAVQVGAAWYGDGGVRLYAPLAPALHLGAGGILAVSTRYRPSRAEADVPVVHGYPPAAQLVGLLMQAVFVDALDQDALRMQLINDLLAGLPRHKRNGLRPIRLLVLRPSRDLAALSHDFEPQLEGALGLLARTLGSGETERPEWLSMILFDEGYIARLIELGYEDARRQHDRIAAFIDGAPAAAPPAAR